MSKTRTQQTHKTENIWCVSFRGASRVASRVQPAQRRMTCPFNNNIKKNPCWNQILSQTSYNSCDNPSTTWPLFPLKLHYSVLDNYYQPATDELTQTLLMFYRATPGFSLQLNWCLWRIRTFKRFFSQCWFKVTTKYRRCVGFYTQ